jgi:hypothetical protein
MRTESARRRLRVVALAATLLASADADADIRVPAGARLQVDGGRIDFSGTSYVGYGVLRLGAGSLERLDDFRIFAGGSADLGSGVLRLAGDWENRGGIAAGTSLVEFLDAPGDSFLLGATEFSSVRAATAQGRRLRLESGNTQRVLTSITLVGTGAPLRIDSSTPGDVAFLHLLAGGSQDITNVAVWDVHASGQPLAPDETNQGGNANVQGWFGSGQALSPGRLETIPATSPLALLLLACGFLAAFPFMRRRARFEFNPGRVEK